MTMQVPDLPREDEEADNTPLPLNLAHLLYSGTTPAFMQPLDYQYTTQKAHAAASVDETKAPKSTPGGCEGDLPLLWRTLLAYRQLRKSQLMASSGTATATDDALFLSYEDSTANVAPSPVQNTLTHVWRALCRPGSATTTSTASPTSLVSDQLSFSFPFSQLPTTTLVRGPYTLTISNDTKDKPLVQLASSEMPDVVVAEQLDAFTSLAPDFVHVRPDAAGGTVRIHLLAVETAPALQRARELGLLLYVFLLQELLDEALRRTDTTYLMAPVLVDGAVCLEGEPAATGGTASSLSHFFNSPNVGLCRDAEEAYVDAVPATESLRGDVGPCDRWRRFHHLSQNSECFSLESTLHHIFHTYVDPFATMMAHCRDTIETIATSTAAAAAAQAAAEAALAEEKKTDTATVSMAAITANGTEKVSKEKDRLAEQQLLFRLLQWRVFAAPRDSREEGARVLATNVPKDGPLPIAAVLLPEQLRHCYRASTGTELPAVLITLMNAKGTLVHFYDDEAVGLLHRALKGLHAEVFVYDEVQSRELFQLLVTHEKETNMPVTSETPFRDQIFELERLLLDLDKLTAAEEEVAVVAAGEGGQEEEPQYPGIDRVLASVQRFDPYTVLMLQRHKKIFKALRRRASTNSAGTPTFAVGDALPPHFYSFLLQSMEENGAEYGERISSNLLQASRRVISKYNQSLRAIK